MCGVVWCVSCVCMCVVYCDVCRYMCGVVCRCVCDVDGVYMYVCGVVIRLWMTFLLTNFIIFMW